VNPFSSIPFLRLILPFLAGLLLGLYFEPVVAWYWTIPFVAAALYLVIAPQKKYSKTALTIVLDLFLILNACAITNLAKDTNKPFHYSKYNANPKQNTIVGVLDDLPVSRSKTVKCHLKVTGVLSGSTIIPASGVLIAYVSHSENDQDLIPGKTLMVRGILSEPQEPMNPFEFDYRGYLRNRQVYHTIYATGKAFKILDLPPLLNGFWLLGLKCKNWLLSSLRHSELTSQAYAICAALLTGYDDDIDRSVLQAFSHSGTLHVLSVSGLHTGLIYLALNFLFSQFDRQNRFKILRFISVTILLWLFALITGFSAPVLRAVIMFNLLGLGRLFFRQSSRNQLNVLLASAFVLLNIEPFWLLDIGFLLSYFAMIGLICFAPYIGSFWKPSNAIVRYCWLSITASLSATVSTLPITLLCFKQFPLWFFLCNIVVVPVTFALLLLAAFMILHLPLVGSLINLTVKLLISFIGIFNSGNAYIDGIHFYASDSLFLSLLIAFVYHAVFKRSYSSTVIVLCILILWQSMAFSQYWQISRQNIFTAYHTRKGGVFSVKNRSEVKLNVRDSLFHDFSVKPHLTYFSAVNADTSNFNFVHSNKERILLVNGKKGWPVAAVQPSWLILYNDAVLSSQMLNSFASLRGVVMLASNTVRCRKNAEDICRKFGIGFYDIRKRGAFSLDLQ
jgi:competence protein ComEC